MVAITSSSSIVKKTITNKAKVFYRSKCQHLQELSGKLE